MEDSPRRWRALLPRRGGTAAPCLAGGTAHDEKEVSIMGNKPCRHTCCGSTEKTPDCDQPNKLDIAAKGFTVASAATGLIIKIITLINMI